MTRRDRLMIIAVLAVAFLGGFWMVILKPQRAAAADAAAQLETARTTLSDAQQQVTAGKAAQAAYRRDRSTFVKLGRVVPETDDAPTLIIQLQALAKKYDVWFTKWTIDSTASAGAAPSSAATSTTTPNTTSTGKDDANASTAAVAPLYPPGSVQMNGGLGRTPITIGLKGEYFNLERYLRAVQRFAVLSQKKTVNNGRLIVIDAFDYKPSERVAYIGSKLTKLKKSTFLESELTASVYFAPPLEAPDASGTASAAGATAAAAATPATASTATGAATVGDLK